jgi:hypothetical protein
VDGGVPAGRLLHERKTSQAAAVGRDFGGLRFRSTRWSHKDQSGTSSMAVRLDSVQKHRRAKRDRPGKSSHPT